MTLVLDSTVAGTSSNAYCSRASCLVILEEDIHIYSTFSALSTANQESCIIFSTSILDEQCEWIGIRATTTQKLRWPRIGAYDVDDYLISSSVIPDFLQRGVSFMSYFLSQSDRISEADTLGFSRLDAGSLRMDIDKYDRRQTIPNIVWSIVKPYCTAMSSRSRTLVRK